MHSASSGNSQWWVLQTVSVAEKKDWVGSTADWDGMGFGMEE
jgi:hypothetical protein